jgi:hypothetical protein
MDKIMSIEEYNNLYNFKTNTWCGPCRKNTPWCFLNKYNTPNYGHLYNRELFNCCNNHLVYLMNKICVASEKFNFKYFLDFGSLLGCLRNNRKIPYDVDIDVGICREELDNFKKAIGFLCENGEKIIGKNNMFVYQLSKINNIHIDFFIYNKINKNGKELYISQQFYQTPKSFFLKEDLFPLKKATFENLEVFIPNKSREYTERNYGIGSIENPITKLSYVNNYISKGTKGDLPDEKKWEELLKKKNNDNS